MVICAMFLIAFIGDTEGRIGCIQTHASLKTTCRDVSTGPLHHHFFDEIFRVLVQMGKTIDLFAR